MMALKPDDDLDPTAVELIEAGLSILKVAQDFVSKAHPMHQALEDSLNCVEDDQLVVRIPEGTETIECSQYKLIVKKQT